jgi:hypothetical protein
MTRGGKMPMADVIATLELAVRTFERSTAVSANARGKARIDG